MKNVLYMASECVPFIKTGGLADVIGSLPKYMNKDEYDIRVILPKYKVIPENLKEKMIYKTNFYMDLSWRNQYVGLFELEYAGIIFYFIDNEFYFTGNTPYGNIYEDIEKFAFYCKACLSALPILDFKPDIIHCHDWQTGLLPVFLKDRFMENKFYKDIKTIMTIHNLKFQGVWDVTTIKDITGLSEYYFTSDKLEAYGNANYLKGGIVYADYITTVSNSYAEEIKTPFYGEGLDGLMRARSNTLSGIVNGIDYDEYNPMTDPLISHNYDQSNFRKLKIKNKRALQEELGLTRGDKKFMIGIVSRLTDQKGFDLIDYVIEELCSEDTQLVLLGTGEQKYENLFRHYAWKYGDRVSANIYYSDERAHKIYAGCDAFLMPSLFEPCGLSQLISLRYGTVPIVRETGGLRDTVEPYNEFESIGTGFSFTNYNAHEMLSVIRYAKNVYFNSKKEWNKLIERGMSKDFSWNNSAKLYEELYNKICI
ncbi:glycogen synthase GlgA [Anaerocolumna sedimenticola]|uniref:Glycogen synthase n=1 Tax=Anaerocolumna sedimenticola TaxID=2696063 RepID=A0A6P1TR83_9FIRM|nr:glycogen synthase GlgA [Anaerocolumna sedimenticola]QHQ62742.1 glycogen synthase GlgA [Anaerocolumna sedimenticola]